MIFRFSLQHDVEGTHSISEPLGWQASKLKLTRDPDFHSLVEEFDINATFYGNNGQKDGGIEFIKQIERTYGVDAELRLIVEMSFDDGITYPLSFTGLLSMDEGEENPNNQITIPVIPDDLWTKFVNRRDTSVDLQSTTDFDENACSPAVDVDLTFTSQIIPKQYEGIFNDSFIVFESDWSPSDFIQLSMDEDVLDELDDIFNLPPSTNPEIPVPIFEPTENGDYIFDLRIECSVIYYEASGTPPNCVSNRFITDTSGIVDFYIQKNNETPIAFTATDSPLILVDRSTSYTYNGTLSLAKGDQIRIYGDITNAMTNGDVANFFIWSVNNAGTVKNVLIDATTCGPIGLFDQAIDLGTAPSTEVIPTYFNIDGQTVFPSTVSESFLLHDVFAAIVRRTTGQDAFYSEVLGSPLTNARSYIDYGCYWNYSLIRGLQIRQYSLAEKPFFQSFNQAWNGANPIFNLGLGLESLHILELPDLTEWLTTTGSDEEWNVGISTPNVNLPGTGPFTPAASEILYVDFTFVSGETYSITLSYNVDYNSGSSHPRSAQLRIYDDLFAIQFEQHDLFPVSPGGSATITLTFVATSDCTKIGIVFTSASDVDVTITGRSGTWTGETEQVIRVEEKAYFYDSSTTSVNFSNVRDIVRGYDKEVIFNKITTGYKKWQSEDISGIDDPQTKHEYASRAKMVGRPIDLTSEFIAASLAIETTRRTTREKSADYKFDNDTFIIALRDPDASPDVDGYVPELDENFSSVTNLQNPDIRYNLILTPLRNLFRWANYLTGWMQEHYLNSSLKFVSGEGNFDMESDYDCTNGNECVAVICDNVSEKQDVSLASYHIPFGYLHLHYLYDITIEITFEEYLTIRNNRNLAIGISLTDSDHVKFFIKELEYTITEGTCKISAWPLTYLDLQVLEQEFTMRCTPSADECENAITDELEQDLTDEEGRCITFS